MLSELCEPHWAEFKEEILGMESKLSGAGTENAVANDGESKEGILREIEGREDESSDDEDGEDQEKSNTNGSGKQKNKFLKSDKDPISDLTETIGQIANQNSSLRLDQSGKQSDKISPSASPEERRKSLAQNVPSARRLGIFGRRNNPKAGILENVR